MSAPYQAVKAADGYFVMGATNQKLWLALCALLDRPDLSADARFATVALRLGNRKELIEALERTFATDTCENWIERLLAAGLAAGPILTYPQAFDSEHGRERRMRIEIDHPIEGKVPNIGFAVKLLGTPQQVRHPPPLLGQHNDEVLGEYGIGEAERRALAAEGAFGRASPDAMPATRAAASERSVTL
jgi:formyl-CoA transferase